MGSKSAFRIMLLAIPFPMLHVDAWKHWVRPTLPPRLRAPPPLWSRGQSTTSSTTTTIAIPSSSTTTLAVSTSSLTTRPPASTVAVRVLNDVCNEPCGGSAAGETCSSRLQTIDSKHFLSDPRSCWIAVQVAIQQCPICSQCALTATACTNSDSEVTAQNSIMQKFANGPRQESNMIQLQRNPVVMALFTLGVCTALLAMLLAKRCRARREYASEPLAADIE